ARALQLLSMVAMLADPYGPLRWCVRARPASGIGRTGCRATSTVGEKVWRVGVKFVAAEFVREHGVSVRTVYRHQRRVRAEGEWRPRSRRPHTSPGAT